MRPVSGTMVKSQWYYQDMDKSKWITGLGIVGTVLAFIMYFALLEVAHSNITINAGIFIQPLAATINCTIWCVYAFLKKDKYVFLANFPGILLGIFTVITAFL